FFQAEDGIRDRNVTGVQTCALPIYSIQYAKAVGEQFINFSYIFIHHRYRLSRGILCHAAECHEHAETAVVGGRTSQSENDAAGAPVTGMEYEFPYSERGTTPGCRACQVMWTACLSGLQDCCIFLHIIDCRTRTAFRPGDIQVYLFISFIRETIQQAVSAITHRFGDRGMANLFERPCHSVCSIFLVQCSFIGIRSEDYLHNFNSMPKSIE